jgi:hypothetical protein
MKVIKKEQEEHKDARVAATGMMMIIMRVGKGEWAGGMGWWVLNAWTNLTFPEAIKIRGTFANADSGSTEQGERLLPILVHMST